MSDVFISYKREDHAAVNRLVAALRAEGVGVWWDQDIPPNAAWEATIERELAAATLVIVAWSPVSVASENVKAEARWARTQGRLLQVFVEPCEPPLFFGERQGVDLKGWKGDAQDPEWVKILEGIAEISGAPRQPVPVPKVASAVRRPAPRGVFLGAVALVLLLAGALWLGWNSLHPAAGPTRIAILPFDTLSSSQDVKDFADGLTDQILTTLADNHFQVVSHDDAATLRGADRDKRVAELGVALLFDGTVQNDGQTLSVTVHLDDPHKHVTLWSGHVAGPSAQGPQLQAELATTIVGVLACSNRALIPVHGLADPALLTRYLRACDIFVNQNNGVDPGDTQEMLSDLRQVTAGAPDFAAAHSDLAKFDGFLAPLLPPDLAASVRAEAATEADRALALDPHSSDAYLAKAFLLPVTQWADREAMLRRGIAADPDWPHTNGFLGMLLSDVGRLKEGNESLRKASTVDLQIDWMPATAFFLGGSGQPGACIDPLSRYVKLVPQNVEAWTYLYDCLQFAGRWRDAQIMLDDPTTRPAASIVQPSASHEAFFRAILSRAAADMAKARTMLLAAPGDSDLVLTGKIQSLSALGYVDEAFAAANQYVPTGASLGSPPSFLFRSLTEPMRRDPRFMRLAQRLGLLNYWRTSGHWPDFCSASGWPYNCQAEAAKLSPPG